MRFEVDEKVLIVTKSIGREFSALHKREFKHWHVMNNIKYPVGWIAEIRGYKYYVIAYEENGRGTDYYTDNDLKKITEIFLEDSLFDI